MSSGAGHGSTATGEPTLTHSSFHEFSTRELIVYSKILKKGITVSQRPRGRLYMTCLHQKAQPAIGTQTFADDGPLYVYVDI